MSATEKIKLKPIGFVKTKVIGKEVRRKPTCLLGVSPSTRGREDLKTI